MYKVYLSTDNSVYRLISNGVSIEDLGYPCIFEVEDPPSFDCPIYQHNNSFYCLRLISDKDKYIVVKECTYDYDVEEGDEVWGESEITCPVCGCVETDSWEYRDEDEYICPDCGSVSSVTRQVETTYTTTVKEIIRPKEV